MLNSIKCIISYVFPRKVSKLSENSLLMRYFDDYAVLLLMIIETEAKKKTVNFPWHQAEMELSPCLFKLFLST